MATVSFETKEMVLVGPQVMFDEFVVEDDFLLEVGLLMTQYCHLLLEESRFLLQRMSAYYEYVLLKI